MQSLSPNYYWIAFDQSYQNSPTILLGNFKSPTQTTESATNINSSIHSLNSPWTSDMHLSHSQKDCKETVHLKMAHSEAQLNLKSVWCNKKSYLDPKILGLVKQSIVFCPPRQWSFARGKELCRQYSNSPLAMIFCRSLSERVATFFASRSFSSASCLARYSSSGTMVSVRRWGLSWSTSRRKTSQRKAAISTLMSVQSHHFNSNTVQLW